MHTIIITSSVEFPTELKSTVEEKLTKKFNGHYYFEYKVDKDLIAGFQVKLGDTELHFDLKSEIEYIQNELV
jgi:F0F1-type ATP synthase delta subunit